jgi:hypothetical protein
LTSKCYTLRSSITNPFKIVTTFCCPVQLILLSVTFIRLIGAQDWENKHQCFQRCSTRTSSIAQTQPDNNLDLSVQTRNWASNPDLHLHVRPLIPVHSQFLTHMWCRVYHVRWHLMPIRAASQFYRTLIRRGMTQFSLVCWYRSHPGIMCSIARLSSALEPGSLEPGPVSTHVVCRMSGSEPVRWRQHQKELEQFALPSSQPQQPPLPRASCPTRAAPPIRKLDSQFGHRLHTTTTWKSLKIK